MVRWSCGECEVRKDPCEKCELKRDLHRAQLECKDKNVPNPA